VAEHPPPPVAVRISRPQATEDEFLEQELETLNRTSVTLLGAQQRPQGVVLRFELVLSSGLVILRGEGRVVGFKPNVLHGMGGLTLRFTRLDSKSKALIDKATALRERRRPSSMPAPPVDASPAAAPVATDPPASVRPPPVAPTPLRPPSVGPPPLPPRAAKVAPPPLPAEKPAAVAPAMTTPGDRNSLLERLRTRAKALDPAAVQRILETRRRA
jgi:hypothetical protein